MTPSQTTGRIVSFCVRFGVVLVLLAGSIGILTWLTGTRVVPPSSDEAAPARTVEVVKVSPRPVARVWVGYGVAEALDSADIPSEVSSIVVEIPDSIDVGRVVEAGQLLVRLDDTDFQQQLEIATRSLVELSTRLEKLELDLKTATELVQLREEEVAILEDELSRLDEARADGAATQREVDLVRQRLIQSRSSEVGAREQLDSIPVSRRLLEAQIGAQEFAQELARRNVERCLINSPINGVLESIEVETGERVDPLGRVARVVDPRKLVVPIRLPSSARASVRVGNRVDMESGGSVPRVWSGELDRISPVDDSSTRTMTVFVELDQSGESKVDPMAPGTFVSARVSSSESRPRLIVPRSAVRNERLWYVDSEGRVASTRVDIDFALESSDGSKRELVIESDLPDGSLVVIDAGRSLSPGTSVESVVIDDHSDSPSGELP